MDVYMIAKRNKVCGCAWNGVRKRVKLCENIEVVISGYVER